MPTSLFSLCSHFHHLLRRCFRPPLSPLFRDPTRTFLLPLSLILTFPYFLDSSSCRHHVLFAHTYFDDHFWQISDTSCFPFFSGIYCWEMLGDVSPATCARGGRVQDVHTLAEPRKEQLEQLPPPLQILDPPFAHGVFFPVGVGVDV